MQAGEIHADPGRILKADGDDLLVSAANGTTLRLSQLQMEGSRRMSVRDFVNGFQPQVGDVLVSSQENHKRPPPNLRRN